MVTVGCKKRSGETAALKAKEAPSMLESEAVEKSEPAASPKKKSDDKQASNDKKEVEPDHVKKSKAAPRTDFDEGVCIGKISCQCPVNTTVGDVCGGGVIIKPALEHPKTNYHLISLKQKWRQAPLRNWADANEHCHSLNKSDKNDWQLPSCGVQGIWRVSSVDMLAEPRSEEYCELAHYIEMLKDQKAGSSKLALLNRIFWSSSSSGKLYGKENFWALDESLAQRVNQSDRRYYVICVRKDHL